MPPVTRAQRKAQEIRWKARDYPFDLTIIQRNQLQDGKNPWGTEETLNCKKVQKFIKACAHLKKELCVTFFSKESDQQKSFIGTPTSTQHMPNGHPNDNDSPSFLFKRNGVDHLVIRGHEEGHENEEGLGRWIRCRQHTIGGITYYPRITPISKGISDRDITINDCEEQIQPPPDRVLRSQVPTTRSGLKRR